MIIRLKLFLAFAFLLTASFGFAQEGKTILENLKANKEYSKFVKALEMTGLDKALEQDDQFTIFVPTNQALKQDQKFVDVLLSGENIEMLTKFVGKHISKESFAKEEMEKMRAETEGEDRQLTIRPFIGNSFTIVPDQTVFKIMGSGMQEAYIVKSDLKSTNGSIHTLSRSLLER